MDKQPIKFEKNEIREMIKIAVIAVVSVCLIIAFYFALARSEQFSEAVDEIVLVLEPFIIGAGLAFIMNPVMKFFEKRWLAFWIPGAKNEIKARRNIRLFATLLALVIVVGLVVIFFVIVIPQLVGAITYIVNHLDQQIMAVLDWADDITLHRFTSSISNAKEMDIDTMLDNLYDFLATYLKLDRESMVSAVTTGAVTAGKQILNIIIGIVAAVYILMEKEHFRAQVKKLLYGFLRKDRANLAVQIIKKANDIFYGFIVGKIIDSIIIGIICYIFCLIARMPYSVLVAFIVGVTNVIPVFGPYIGAVPTVIIIFVTNPVKGIYFLIFILVLQQIDGNIIGPKILGDSTGLSSIWVLFAIVVGGAMFGVVGMILGVPTMSLVYYIMGLISSHMVQKRKLPTETVAYTYLDSVDENNTIIELTPESSENDMPYLGRLIKSKSKQKSDDTENKQEPGE